MDKNALANCFNAHNIFLHFWNDSIWDCFKDGLELDFMPNEYISLYQKRFNFQLNNLSGKDEFAGLSASLELIFTSSEKEFNIERAVSDIDSKLARSAILVKIEVRDASNQVVFSTQFNLGSAKKEQIMTDSAFMKIFSAIY